MADAFRRFRVTRKQTESRVITSFYLTPADGGGLFQARPGQYLTLRVPGGVLRTYSLSSAIDAPEHRISVKRETGGIGSGWLHDTVTEGSEIEIAGPRGAFVLDEGSDRPVLLLAGGVGITPLLSMLHRIVATGRRAYLVQAAEDGSVHAMGAEIAALAAKSDGMIMARRVFRHPLPNDRAGQDFDDSGVIDRALLQALLPIGDYQVYLCGPQPFMIAMWQLLTDLGVDPSRIAYEFFGKGASLAALAATAAMSQRPVSRIPARAPASLALLEYLTNPAARAADPPDDAALVASPSPQAVGVWTGAPAGGDDQVLFARSGVTVFWTGAQASLLELAEAAGLAPDFSCREGICNTCRTTLLEGAVIYDPAPLDIPPAGQTLLCCTRPAGRVVLDL